MLSTICLVGAVVCALGAIQERKDRMRCLSMVLLAFILAVLGLPGAIGR